MRIFCTGKNLAVPVCKVMSGRPPVNHIARHSLGLLVDGAWILALGNLWHRGSNVCWPIEYRADPRKGAEATHFAFSLSAVTLLRLCSHASPPKQLTQCRPGSHLQRWHLTYR